MTEIPEHLLKRSAERRKALGLPGGEDAPAEGPAPEAVAPAAEATAEPAAPVEASAAESDAPVSAEAGKIPAHLLERSKKRKAALAGGGAAATAGEGTATGGGGTATATRPVAAPTATGPGGHTQRLLTVVKSGSIQQVKAETQDKVHTWPHLLVVEFTALLGITALLIIFSALVRAPLLGLADINQTPNPSKAPWYFLGLQELLTMFHPMVAGVTIPGIGLFMLMVAPYVDKNPSNKPSDRKFVVSLFTIFLMFWAVLVIIGSFFRGAGFNFVFPWNDGIFFEL